MRRGFNKVVIACAVALPSLVIEACADAFHQVIFTDAQLIPPCAASKEKKRKK
jgi:hypothetical protein